MKSFVDKVSSYEGAEIPNVGINFRDKNRKTTGDKINFNPHKFMESIQDLLCK